MLNQHPDGIGLMACGLRVVEITRQLIQEVAFCGRHRMSGKDFTRRRSLPFDRVMILLLQKTVRSVQGHLHEFFERLEEGLRPVTASAWSQARQKLRHTAFIELNEKAIVEVVKGGGTDFVVRRWKGHRLVGMDSSLLTLPCQEEVGREFGWVECRNQEGACGRYAQGRMAVLTDVLNRLALEGLLVPWRQGERDLARQQAQRMEAEDIAIMDRGYASYELWAHLVGRGRKFVCRCARNSFSQVNRLFRQNRAGVSQVVWLHPPDGKMGAVRQEGLREKIQVRLVTVRLPSGELEVLATNLLDAQKYPTKEFAWLYHQRWGVETFYGQLKSRLDLENFTGQSVEAVRQDFHAAIFLSNLETILTRPAQEQLAQQSQSHEHPKQANHAVCFHALKNRLMELLLSQEPIPGVVLQLQELFLANPVSVRPRRKVPRQKVSAWRSYRYQRNVKKSVF
jgi:Transposase DDE domain